MREILKMALMAFILIPCCVTDMRDRTLPAVWLMICTAAGMAVSVFWKEGWGIWAVGMFPGIGLFVMNFITKGGIGRGDAYLYLAVGSVIGLWDSLLLLFVSLFLASCYGGYLLKIRKKGRKHQIPFAPFTAAGYLLLLLISTVT